MERKLKRQLQKLEEKYKAMGQDLSSYLDGLLQSDYLTYWDYIHLDTLLSLQTPKTAFPDEKIFILYHQITELYFRLILNEIEQICFKDLSEDKFLMRIKRIANYFGHLVNSFETMIDGMEQEQFMAFRMALLPSSGFQSAQYRKIEIMCTSFYLLTDSKKPDESQSIKTTYENLYWKKGATELATNKKTLTLKQFEKKYSAEFIHLAKMLKSNNLRIKYLENFKHSESIRKVLRSLDHKANVQWPLQHLKAATTYLQRDPKLIEATGGTNWQKYLPPLHQKISFFPEVWTSQELNNWGKNFKINE